MALKHNKGFTLAEVLITLVIIGVIAAITIPTLMANARRQEASSRLKKFYSTLSQASIKAKAMGNDWEEWADSASLDIENENADTVEAFAKQYLLPYLNYTDTAIKDSVFYIYLADGTFFTIHKGWCIDMVIDINGLKKPNEHGRDKFDIFYCPRNQTVHPGGHVSPWLELNSTRERAMELCKTKNYSCSGLLAIDNWEFKEDYPYSI